MRVGARLVLLALAALCLGGCSQLGRYEGGNPGGSPASPQVHVVASGETLFSIAFRYRLDQNALARWNGLDNPNRIYAGQRLRLTPPSGAAASRPAASTPRNPGSGATGSSQASAPPRPAPTVPPPPVLAPPAWAWPTDGAIATRFGAREGIATGIGIGGQAGQAVRAAAQGSIVYVGTGLAGYGQLVIVSHNDTYLTAYGYLGRTLVTQGQQVARGETIAAMGLGPERAPRLHFEIRRNGTPVDPLTMLPAP